MTRDRTDRTDVYTRIPAESRSPPRPPIFAAVPSRGGEGIELQGGVLVEGADAGITDVCQWGICPICRPTIILSELPSTIQGFPDILKLARLRGLASGGSDFRAVG